jgi:phosphoglycerate kinase
MAKLSIRDVPLSGKRVFLRVDFNVPLNDAREITEDTRIRASIPTIQYALDHDAKLILATHLGRPKGKPDPKFSLRPVAARLSELLGAQVVFADDCVGPGVEQKVVSLKQGEALLLENLRFHAGEEKNDPEFARRLAALAECYVNDAFGTAHRAHASTEGITHFLSPCAAGFLMEKELRYLSAAVENPERPYIAIVGGVKVSDKINLLKNLIKSADTVLVGGAMAYTFLKAEGVEVARSRVEDDKLHLAQDLGKFAAERKVTLRLPQDHVVSTGLDAGSPAEVVNTRNIPPDRLGVDIGPATRAEYAADIRRAKTIVWNGPMGVFEVPQFAEGTLAVAHAVAGSGAISIVGGGDSVAAVTQAGVASKITHISTGGGASLEFLSGMKLPGVEALSDRK